MKISPPKTKTMGLCGKCMKRTKLKIEGKNYGTYF
jgi:hypothetical protein